MEKSRITLDMNKFHILIDFYAGTSAYKSKIRDYFIKSNYRSEAFKFKEGSQKLLKAIEKDKEVASIPNYDVKFVRELIIRHSYHNVKLNIMSITIPIYDDIDDVTVNHDYYFTTSNKFRGHDVCTNLNELMSHTVVMNLFKNYMSDTLKENIFKKLREFSSGAFDVLLNKIHKAEENLIDVNYYSEYDNLKKTITIGKGDSLEVFGIDEMLEITKAYKDEVRFYENDELVDFNFYDDYVDYYRKYKPKD